MREHRILARIEMDKIIYTRGTFSKEVQKIELDVTDNLDVHEFKLIDMLIILSISQEVRARKCFH